MAGADSSDTARVAGIVDALGFDPIVLGIWGDLGALGVAVLLVVIAFTMHAFWKESDTQAKQTELVSFNKNLGLAGGALFFWSFFNYDAVPWAITGPLFH